MARLKIQVLPYDDVDFTRVLDALVQYGSMRRYTVGGVAYGVVPSFPQHQVFNSREKESALPAPAQDESCAGPASGQRGKEGKGVPTESAACDAAVACRGLVTPWQDRGV